MKILYVSHGHFWGSTWPYSFIDDSIISTLKSLGHDVRQFDIFTRADIYHKTLASFASQPEYFEILTDRASADLPFEVLEFEPDLVLHIVGIIGLRILNTLKKLKTNTAVWFLDDPQEIDFTSQKAQFYSHVFTTEEAAVPVYWSAGNISVNHMPLGYDKDVFKRLGNVSDKYKSDICFIGVPFESRVAFFDEIADFLKDYNVKIIGGGKNIGSLHDPWLWKRKLKRLDTLEKFIIDEVVEPSEAAKYFNGAKIVLNIHRAAVDARFSAGNKDRIMPVSPNDRTFKIAGCGAFQLIDSRRPGVLKMFESCKEIVTFSDEDDFFKKIRYYIEHSDERESIGRAALNRAILDHTIEKRLNKILKICQGG